MPSLGISSWKGQRSEHLKAIAQYPEIENYLPHRPPFLFVSGILSLEDAEGGRCYLDLHEGYPYLEGGVFPSLLVVESLGQAVAVLQGYRFAALGPKQSVMGYLVKLNDFQFEGTAAVGDRIILAVRPRRKLGKLILFHGEAWVAGKRLCFGEMTFLIESDE